jgi:glycosyltransferase involved in cell wall biosynthesis
MKILVFTKLYWPEGGGAELATHLVVGLLSRHFDISVVSGTARPEPAVLRQVRYLQWNALRSRYKPDEWLRLLAGARHVWRLLERADVVYIPSHTLMPLAIAAKLAKPSIKVVLHLHNYQALTFTSVILADQEPNMITDVTVELREHKSLVKSVLTGFGHYLNFLNSYALRYADKVICVSRRQYEIMTYHLPWLRNKAVIIYNPPPNLPSIAKKVDETPLFVYPGGGSYVKGFHIFLKLLTKILLKKNSELRIFVTYGRDVAFPERLVLEKLSRKIYDHLVVLGRLPYSEYLKLHERAWGLLFPSIWEEPLPYAVVESALLGTVPVASRVGGVPEVVEGTPAEEYLFAPGSAEELAEKVEMLASQPRERALEVGAKLRERALKLFDAEKIGNDIIGLFESLLSDR